jgi:hypothetical protein
MTYVGNERKREHTWLAHGPGECPSPGSCNVCDGGLGLCTVCGGAEGTLTLDCPGEPVSSARQEAVYAGRAEFVRGRWYVSVDALQKDGCGQGIDDTLHAILGDVL